MSNAITSRFFSYVHSHHLVYNTCWEDPRIDREALELTAHDRVLVITSAGCNALDYVIAGAGQVAAVDMNPRQNALLELKIAAIEALEYEEFFSLFGRGGMPRASHLYRTALRSRLSAFAKGYWDSHIGFFESDRPRGGFYFRGSSGLFARLINWYIDVVARARPLVDEILESPTLADQQRTYRNHLRPAFWKRPLRWMLDRDATLALVGVPAAQRRQLERTFGGRIGAFVENALDEVFETVPLIDNYFYRVYLTGQYSENCCPEYLKREHFLFLKEHARAAISVHTNTILEFLEESGERFNRFVLLDHMDWLADAHPDLLQAEWQAIVDHAAPDARVLWRSGGTRVEYVDPIRVRWRSSTRTLGSLLQYDYARAQRLHALDRVRTYGSFYIADLPCAA